MDTVGQAALDIIPRPVADFDRRLERDASGAMVAAGASGGRKYGDAAGRSMVSSLRSHAATAAKISAGILVGAGYAAFKLGQSSYAEAQDAMKVGRLTANVIESTGGAAKTTRAEVEALSEALSNKAGIDDEVIQRGANVLLTFTKIRNEVGKGNDVFNQATTAVADYAAFMAQGKGGELDLKSASIQVGKALNDPVKGITALGKAGVQFTEQQKKKIESLVDEGKQLDAQKIILGELQTQFGGAAEAQATMGDKVSVAWGNIQEKLGTAALPLIRDFQKAILRDGLPAAERFADWFQSDGVPAAQGFVDEVRPLANELIPALASTLGDVRDIAQDALPYAKDLIGAFNDMPDWAKKGLAVGGLAAYAGKKTGIIDMLLGGGGAGKGLLGAFTKAAPMPVYVVNNDIDVPGKPGVPGVVGTGKPGVPVIPPILGKGLPFLARAASLVALPLNNTRDKVNPNYHGIDYDNIGSEADFMKVTGEKRAAAFREWIEESNGLSDATKDLITGQQHLGVIVGGNDGKVKKYGDTLGRTGLKKVDPKFTTPGLPEARNSTQRLLSTLTGVDRSWRPRVDVDTGDSLARINAVRTAILNLPALGSRGAGLGVLASQGGPAPERPKKQGGPARRRPVKLMVGDREMGGYVDDLIGSDRDLQGESERAGRP